VEPWPGAGRALVEPLVKQRVLRTTIEFLRKSEKRMRKEKEATKKKRKIKWRRKGGRRESNLLVFFVFQLDTGT
jgi:transposase